MGSPFTSVRSLTARTSTPSVYSRLASWLSNTWIHTCLVAVLGSWLLQSNLTLASRLWYSSTDASRSTVSVPVAGDQVTAPSQFFSWLVPAIDSVSVPGS